MNAVATMGTAQGLTHIRTCTACMEGFDVRYGETFPIHMKGNSTCPGSGRKPDEVEAYWPPPGGTSPQRQRQVNATAPGHYQRSERSNVDTQAAAAVKMGTLGPWHEGEHVVGKDGAGIVIGDKVQSDDGDGGRVTAVRPDGSGGQSGTVTFTSEKTGQSVTARSERLSYVISNRMDRSKALTLHVQAGELQKFQVSRASDGRLEAGKWDRGMTFGVKEKEGQTTDFSTETFAQMITNWKARGEPLSLCYNHQSAYAKDNGQPAPALAFYDAVAVVKDGQVVQFEKLARSMATAPDVVQLSQHCSSLLATDENPNPSPDGCWWYRSEHTDIGERLLSGFKFLSPMFVPNGTNEAGEDIGYTIFDLAATNTAFQGGCMINFDRHGLDKKYKYIRLELIDIQIGDTVAKVGDPSLTGRVVRGLLNGDCVVSWSDGTEGSVNQSQLVKKMDRAPARTMAIKEGSAVENQSGRRGYVNAIRGDNALVRWEDGDPVSTFIPIASLKDHGSKRWADEPGALARTFAGPGYQVGDRIKYVDEYGHGKFTTGTVTEVKGPLLTVRWDTGETGYVDTRWAEKPAYARKLTGALARRFANGQWFKPLAEWTLPKGARARMFAASYDWVGSAQAYLKRLGDAEYEQQRKQRGFKRFAPSAYMRELIELLGRNDEEGFKSLKMLQGYANALGFEHTARSILMAQTATCPFCGTEQSTEPRGLMKTHDYPTGGTCRGSGQRPGDTSVSTGAMEARKFMIDTDNERRLWVMNHEPLYRKWQASGLSIEQFVQQNKEEINRVIRKELGETMDRKPGTMARMFAAKGIEEEEEWFIATDEGGAVLDVSALLSGAQESARRIGYKTGLPTFVKTVRGRKPNIGETVSMDRTPGMLARTFANNFARPTVMASLSPGQKVRIDFKKYLGKDEQDDGVVREIDPNGDLQVDTARGVMTVPRDWIDRMITAMDRKPGAVARMFVSGAVTSGNEERCPCCGGYHDVDAGGFVQHQDPKLGDICDGSGQHPGSIQRPCGSQQIR